MHKTVRIKRGKEFKDKLTNNSSLVVLQENEDKFWKTLREFI